MSDLWQGADALKYIDQNLHKLRADSIQMDSQLQNLTSNYTSLQHQRLDTLRGIATIRLSEIENGRFQSTLNEVDRNNGVLLEERKVAYNDLLGRIEDQNERLKQSELDREKLVDRLNVTARQVADQEAHLQQSLAEDKDYLQLVDEAKRAISIAAQAQAKVDRSLSSMQTKSTPYQADKLFMYLWRSGYGTTKYSAGFFARFVDGWVARIINFEPARQNYWNLTEIPKRLSEHAEAVASQSDLAHDAVNDYELEQSNASGLTDLRSALRKRQSEIDEKDDEIVLKEENLQSSLAERAKFDAGDDRFIRQSIEEIALLLKNKDLDYLNDFVGQTASYTDDELAQKLWQFDHRLNALKKDLVEVKKIQSNKATKLKEFQDLRINFKNSRFDDLRSGFVNKGLLVGLVSQFVQGLVSGADLWSAIKRNQNYRDIGPLPDFGSGGLGNIDDLADILLGSGSRRRSSRRRRTRRGSTWSRPSPRRSRGRSSRRSGGGFRTGGGF